MIRPSRSVEVLSRYIHDIGWSLWFGILSFDVWFVQGRQLSLMVNEQLNN